MDINWLAAVTGFAIALTSTPGPNNTMAAASGANYGFRKTLPLMSGVAVGVALILMLVAMMSSPITQESRVHEILKWVGFVYLAWSAWKIAKARPAVPGEKQDGEEDQSKPFTIKQGGLLQFVNVKLWVIAAGAVATYGSAAGAASPIAVGLLFALIFGTATFASLIMWTMIGVGVGRIVRTARAMRIFNYVMAGLLVASLIPVMLE
ncbi:LysE family translocator [Actinomadura sp. KC216]|uniref:LysE family translocator n=1 Tax=Actinomadura sp. KC216 TaxID=2530370 RepID=UPI001047F69A|nr:LysE family translocator [Actinomadura sp. KC216]TDB84788.1 LysE family translocator [Actinomadura sp. KC216]